MTPGLWPLTKTGPGVQPITIASGFMSASTRRTTPDKSPSCENAYPGQNRRATSPRSPRFEYPRGKLIGSPHFGIAMSELKMSQLGLPGAIRLLLDEHPLAVIQVG